MRAVRGLLPAVLLLCTACLTGAPLSSGGAPVPASAVALQVPYVAQSVLLCGGAAIAMIERWWDRRGVFASEFAHLVRAEEGGIRTTDLTDAMTSRGWQAQAVTGTPAIVRQSLADSAPVIALIRVGERRYHYVVILAWREGTVTYHDPAVSPFATLDTTAFLQRWRGAKQWALLVKPNLTTAATTPVPPAATRTTVDSLPCRPWLDQAADAAAAGDLGTADARLVSASTRCANEPLVLRERAGVRFRQGRHGEAAKLAVEYTRLAPNDSLGWQLLASSRYLAGDAPGALDAWNRVGRPIVDLIRIDGIRRTRFSEVLGVSESAPGEVLTRRALAITRRRIADMPTLGATRVTYAAVTGGVVELRAVVNERPMIEPARSLFFSTAVDALFRRDIHLSLASPLRLGELWTMQWRWQQADPRIAVRVAIPARLGIPVVAHLEQSWETYRFAGRSTPDEREAAALQFTGWTRPSLDAIAGVRVERWAGRGEYVAVTAGTGFHDARDRVGLLVEGDHAFPRDEQRAYSLARARAAFTPPIDRWQMQWTMRLGVDVATAGTPTALQPLAGGDFARAIPLRAHPFIVDRVLPTARIARTVMHGGIAGDRAVFQRGPLRLGAGVFLDGAQLRDNAEGDAQPRFYLDAGAGLRIGLAGTQWSALRIDVARGLTFDRRWGLTAGLAPPWPIRLGRRR